MKKQLVIYIALICIMIFVFNACATVKPIKGVPDWFINTPQKTGFIYEAGEAESADIQLAVSKATLSATAQLMTKLNSDISGLMQRAAEEIRDDVGTRFFDQFSQTQEQVMATTVKNVRVIEREVQEVTKRNNTAGGRINNYRAYVLVEYDDWAATRKLISTIKEDELLYNTLRATELYEEMEQKVTEFKKKRMIISQ